MSTVPQITDPNTERTRSQLSASRASSSMIERSGCVTVPLPGMRWPPHVTRSGSEAHDIAALARQMSPNGASPRPKACCDLGTDGGDTG